MTRNKKLAAMEKRRKRTASQANLNRNNNANNDPSGSQPLRRSTRERRPTAAAAAARPDPPTRMSTRSAKRKDLPDFESGGEHSDSGTTSRKPLQKKSKTAATVTSETIGTETVVGNEPVAETEPTPGPSHEGEGNNETPADADDVPTYQEYENAPSPEPTPDDSSVDLTTKKAVVGYEKGEIIFRIPGTENDSVAGFCSITS